MKTFKLNKISYTLLILFIGLACNFLSPHPPDGAGQATSDQIFTQAAQTVQAQLTSEAVLFPTATTTATATQPEPTQFLPTQTPWPTYTQVPTKPPDTPVPVACNLAYFINDVTIPDRTLLPAGSAFTKVWRLKNIGSCTWTKDYALMFDGGDKMNGKTLAVLSHKVLPGQSIDV